MLNCACPLSSQKGLAARYELPDVYCLYVQYIEIVLAAKFALASIIERRTSYSGVGVNACLLAELLEISEGICSLSQYGHLILSGGLRLACLQTVAANDFVENF